MQNARLGESQAGIKTTGRNINNLRYTDDITLMAKCEEELRSLLIRVKEGSGKSDLKLSIKQTKIIAPGPIASCQIDGEKVEVVTDFLYLDSKITADSEIKRYFLLKRKAMTNLESILKSRDISLLAKAQLDKAMVFPVVTYGCESWTIKKAEC